jgi:hypothetical protein
VFAPNVKLRSKVVPNSGQNAAHTCEHAAHSAPVRLSWARMLKRVFDIDVERCVCGGKLKFIIAMIEQPELVEKILTYPQARVGFALRSERGSKATVKTGIDKRFIERARQAV